MKYNTKLSADLIRVVPVSKNEWEFEFLRLDGRVYDVLYSAIDALEAGDRNKAVKEFQLLIEGFPEFLDAYHHLAMAYDEMGKHDQALGLWQVAAEIGKNAFPDSFNPKTHRLPWADLENRQFLRVYHAWGLELLNMDTLGAVKVFREMLSINPNDNKGIRALAIDCYFRLGKPEKVVSLCRRYRSDTMEQVLYGRPLALFQLGQFEDAKAALQNAINCLPNVASELLKKTHRPPAGLNPQCVTVGGADQAFQYWQDQGQYWKKTDGALEFLSSVLKGK